MPPYNPLYSMAKTIRVSEHFHEWVRSHKRDDETMEDALLRLTGGPNPRDVAGILSEETAEEMKTRLEEKRERSIESKREIRERFE